MGRSARRPYLGFFALRIMIERGLSSGCAAGRTRRSAPGRSPDDAAKRRAVPSRARRSARPGHRRREPVVKPAPQALRCQGFSGRVVRMRSVERLRAGAGKVRPGTQPGQRIGERNRFLTHGRARCPGSGSPDRHRTPAMATMSASSGCRHRRPLLEEFQRVLHCSRRLNHRARVQSKPYGRGREQALLKVVDRLGHCKKLHVE